MASASADRDGEGGDRRLQEQQSSETDDDRLLGRIRLGFGARLGEVELRLGVGLALVDQPAEQLANRLLFLVDAPAVHH